LTLSDTPYPDPAPAPQPPAPKGSNGLATAGFVLGLLGLLGSWIPVLNIVGIILGVLGAVLAAVGLARSKKVSAGKGLAIAGLVMGVLAVIFAIAINAVFVDAVDDAIDDADKSTHSTVSADPSTSGEATKDDTSDDSSDGDPTFVDGVYTDSDVSIKITRHKVIKPGETGNEYGDKPLIGFWYKTTNLSGKETDPINAWIFSINAFQDNDPNAENELEIGPLPDDRFLDSQTENIKKGGTVENAVAYELDDLTTPVDLVAAELFGDEIGTVTYKLR
jgi:hypothetical protein